MATPVRNIIRKGISPNILKSPNLLLVTPKSTRSQNFVKRLQFSNTYCDKKKIENDLGIASLNPTKTIIDTGASKFTITVSEPEDTENKTVNKTQLPFVNTPDRAEILKTGIYSKDNWNILGKGSYGTVIKAIYKSQQIAVKVVPNKLRNNSLNREINSLNLNHSNIVKTLKIVNEVNKNYGIVLMQDCSDSLNLQNILHEPKYKISFNLIKKWCLDICQALEYCHRNNILHLDIKPKNILVQTMNHCRICDFGNSIKINSEQQKHFINLGTIAYTAPELFKNTLPDYSCDIYSLGITMWQMDSREMPYVNIDNKDALIYFVVKHNLRPNITKSINPVVFLELYQNCWIEYPKLRPSIQEIMKKIQSF